MTTYTPTAVGQPQSPYPTMSRPRMVKFYSHRAIIQLLELELRCAAAMFTAARSCSRLARPRLAYLLPVVYNIDTV